MSGSWHLQVKIGLRTSAQSGITKHTWHLQVKIGLRTSPIRFLTPSKVKIGLLNARRSWSLIILYKAAQVLLVSTTLLIGSLILSTTLLPPQVTSPRGSVSTPIRVNAKRHLENIPELPVFNQNWSPGTPRDFSQVHSDQSTKNSRRKGLNANDVGRKEAPISELPRGSSQRNVDTALCSVRSFLLLRTELLAARAAYKRAVPLLENGSILISI